MADREEEYKKAASLEKIGRNLTALAEMGAIGPIYERKEIIAEIGAKLGLQGNNVILVGESGTGKNAAVEGLACWMARGEANLPYRLVIECTHVSFQAFCLYAHEFETKVQLIINEMKEYDALLFFDQINLAVGAGSVSGFEERTLANLLNPYLARTEICILGAATPDGYKAMLRANPSFTSKFIPLDIPATNPSETLAILADLKPRFEEKYEIGIRDSVPGNDR